MSDVLRVSIVDPNDASRMVLKKLVLGIDSLWLEADSNRYEFFLDVISQSNPHIALVSLDADHEKALTLISDITQQLPQCAVLAICSSQEGTLILRAMRNGAKEFLNYPLHEEDLLSALDRVCGGGPGKGLASGGRSGGNRVISVAGVEGGVGCTAIAVNIACMLARNENNSVALIDLDLSLGDADVWLDLIPENTVQDVTENISRLDYSLLKRSLTRHKSGVYLLARPTRLEENSSVSPDSLRRMIALLKATFTHLILDVSKHYGPLEVAAFAASDTILLVTQLDLSGLRNVVRLNKYFDQYEGINEKIRIVLNRMGMDEVAISLNKAKETIGHEIFCQLPNDYAAMVESRNNGIPLQEQAPKARITKAIEAVANVFENSEEVGASVNPKKKGLFGLFGG
ncbi:MAG TPA: AAA family ATPase [Planctomycetaceae bacterium]|nr:AAA family ATPase [Planctomycetaceae bacterium]